ncbi:MAG: response regulator, partial [Methylocystis sp.]|nr:response regulator [Methylocystis sp.]
AGTRALIVARTIFEAPLLASVLRSAGAGAEIAAGERPGLERLAAAAPFSAVIVDCALGEAATERLAAAAREANAGRIFVLFSPLERRAFGAAALRCFDGWLVKPVRAASLIERLCPVAPPAPETSAPAAAPTLCGLHVLVAEDNEINALIACRCLAKLGALVTRAENGARAVEAAQDAIDGRIAPFDVILMDLFMPELDGLEAARRIRLAAARAGAPRTPILALTASAQEEDARAARAAGVNAVLAKPVDFAALGQAIERLAAASPILRVQGRSAAKVREAS